MSCIYEGLTPAQQASISSDVNGLGFALIEALCRKSATVVAWLLENGATYHLDQLDSSLVCGEGTTIEIVEILLMHGWDINSRTPGTFADAVPLLWFIVSDAEFVHWALDHGAETVPKGRDVSTDDAQATRDRIHCRPLLEYAAAGATVEIFDLLQARGAVLGPSCLHRAVQSASESSNQERQSRDRSQRSPTSTSRAPSTQSFGERMAMVRHLVNDLRLNVNAYDDDPPFPMIRGTPLEFLAGPYSPEPVARELLWFLLDSAADPAPAIAQARSCERYDFIRDIESWDNQRH